MNRISIAILSIVVASMFPNFADAQKGSIYSWTDENGIKHFSDRAPAEVSAHNDEIPVAYETLPMDTSTGTLNNETVAEGADDNQAAAADELSYADQQRLEMDEKRKAQRELRAERQRVCLQARDRLAQVEPSRRVFYTDENGETTRMDDEERVQMVEEAKGLITEYCD
ncbi:MAG: DUF4124 domain-containing protein [Xanthomonadales bacterium]|nr:DUF4124 domain-containing protein [Xanthomonadales bacterium]